MKTKAIVFSKKGNVDFREVGLAKLDSGKVLLNTRLSLISPGTETRILQSGHPQGKFPMVPGYISVAEVIKIGPNVKGFKEGDLVYASGGNLLDDKEVISFWGCHSKMLVYNADKLIKLGGKAKIEEYAFSKLLSISLRGIRLSEIEPGEKVVVIGLGMIGQLCVRSLLTRGAEVIAFDLSKLRLSYAQKVGAATVNPEDCNMAEAVKKIWCNGADVVFECTGRPGVVQSGINMLRARRRDCFDKAPKIVLQANYTEDIVFNHRTAFNRELEFVFSRDQTREDINASVKMIEEGIVKVEDFITTKLNPKDAQTAYDNLIQNKDAYLTCLYDWSLV